MAHKLVGLGYLLSNALERYRFAENLKSASRCAAVVQRALLKAARKIIEVVMDHSVYG